MTTERAGTEKKERLSAAEKKAREQARLLQMWEYEKNAQAQGFHLIAGVDEAGRGPWAGPVAAAAVVLPADFYLEGVDDSKKLTPKKREALAEKIRHMALDWTVVLGSAELIDRVNILEATKQVMARAVHSLMAPPDCLLLDAITLPQVARARQIPIVKGDQKSISIACASILAKVTRDAAMEAYDGLYPGYGFLQHKGYGTKAHMEALRTLGSCPLHRRSYRPVQEIDRERNGGK